MKEHGIIYTGLGLSALQAAYGLAQGSGNMYKIKLVAS